MKKIFSFILLLLLLTFSSKSQQYQPLVVEGAVWNQEIFLYGIPFFDVNGYRDSFCGDTLIENHVFKKLCSENLYYYQASGSQAISGSNGNTGTELIGALMEDSSKKVWFKSFIEGPIECTVFKVDSTYLLYDFGVEQGDTIYWSWPPSTITSIDSIELLNGEFRKRFNINSIWGNETWIEGIGSNHGFFSPIDLQLECGANLTCYRNNFELLYENFIDSSAYLNCDSIRENLSINDFANAIFTFQISPNPATDFLTINFSSPNFSSAQIKITDVLGRNLLSEEIESGKPLQIPVEKFSFNNIIFCQLWEEGELIGVKKVLIDRQ